MQQEVVMAIPLMSLLALQQLRWEVKREVDKEMY
jgi:hypothetical protein